MSLASWKRMYYPVPAENLLSATRKEAIQHSLNKWLGVLPVAMAAHEVKRVSSRLFEIKEQLTHFDLSASSCALCVKYNGGLDCLMCPLRQLRGVRCDAKLPVGASPTRSRSLEGPWNLALRGDANPMIDLLAQALSRESEASAPTGKPEPIEPPTPVDAIVEDQWKVVLTLDDLHQGDQIVYRSDGGHEYLPGQVVNTCHIGNDRVVRITHNNTCHLLLLDFIHIKRKIKS